jgi:hypothetical protein
MFESDGNLLKSTRKIFELEEMCENEKRIICGELSFSASIQKLFFAVSTMGTLLYVFFMSEI